MEALEIAATVIRLPKQSANDHPSSPAAPRAIKTVRL
jgi:hypothetical protein